MGQAAIAEMEKFTPLAEQMIIGHVREKNGILIFNPVSLIQNEVVDSIYLKGPGSHSIAVSSHITETETASVEEESEEVLAGEEKHFELAALSPLKGVLLSFSERGLNSLNADHIADLQQRTMKMEMHGLTLFAQAGKGLELSGTNRARRILLMLYLITQHETLARD